MKRAVVTGAGGFIGSHLCEYLVSKQVQVIAIDSLTNYYNVDEKLDNLDQIKATGVEKVDYDDLAISDLVAHFQDIDVVFHLAGRPGVRLSFEDYQGYVHDNLVGTARVVEACLRAKVKKLVFASSSSVYGNAPLPYTEQGPTEPISPYGNSKLIAEKMVLSASQAGLNTVALRYFTVFGPRQRPDMAIRRFIEAALSSKPVKIFGDGEQSRDFTFVKDIVHASYLAAIVPQASGPINIGGGQKVTINQTMDLIGKLLGTVVPREYISVSKGDPTHTASNLTKAEQVLGYRSSYSFEEGLSQQIEWMKQKMELEN